MDKTERTLNDFQCHSCQNNDSARGLVGIGAIDDHANDSHDHEQQVQYVADGVETVRLPTSVFTAESLLKLLFHLLIVDQFCSVVVFLFHVIVISALDFYGNLLPLAPCPLLLAPCSLLLTSYLTAFTRSSKFFINSAIRSTVFLRNLPEWGNSRVCFLFTAYSSVIHSSAR